MRTSPPLAYRLDDRGGGPLHLQAERFVRSLIEREEVGEGGLLPPETLLADRLGVSRGTMRGAIQRIVQDGLLERKPGVGTRVVRRKVYSGVGAWGSFTREMAGRGIAVENLSLARRLAPAPAEAARELRIARGRTVLLLDRVRGWNGVPIGRFRSYFAPWLDLGPSLALDRPLYDAIEERRGVAADRSEEELTAVVADRRLAAALQVPAGHPLLRRIRTVYDRAGRPMEYAIIHYRCDNFALTLKLTKEAP